MDQLTYTRPSSAGDAYDTRPEPTPEPYSGPALTPYQQSQIVTRAELIELWQASRVALCTQSDSRYMRLCWAARELHAAHAAQGVTASGAYKLIEAATLGS